MKKEKEGNEDEDGLRMDEQCGKPRARHEAAAAERPDRRPSEGHRLHVERSSRLGEC